ncbi:MAG TPA: S8 family serine peptidase, partial [Symbiobacteriaceae bacterium]|nr:S8 family serine peptidase [Symbiobacteriaceae bacterium]
GVAPKAQLIAEKVFSNTPDTRSAWTDDLVAAIDDSVNPDSPYHPGVKANVLNMSLGSVSGFSDPTDPEQIAIKNAVAAGAVVAISSGNSGYSTSSIYSPYYRNQDIQAAGSPGTSLDAITVASSLNTTVTVEGRELLAKIDGAAPTSVNTVFQDGDGPFGAFETFGSETFPLALPTGSILGCSAADFGNLTGKVALIKRGSCNFSVKVANAAAAGAEAAIIYTQNPDPDLLTMAVGATSTIPAVMIMNSYGTELATALGTGKAVTVAFNGGMVSKSIADGNGDTMASSSSWGTTPDLKLKPDVTAPGANIWSSIPNNQYASFSGTSMAAPHVAGASALIMEAHPDYTPADVKAALMNTAKLLKPIGYPYPYSPRQQGAGRIQVDKAVATNVLVKDTLGFGSLSLGELSKTTPKEFTLNLKNNGDTDATFDLSSAVYRPGTSSTWFNSLLSAPLAGATITFTEGTSVTVPAGGTAQVHGTLDLSGVTPPLAADFGFFAEGFISFTSSNPDAQPSLSVPFMGYLGKWAGPTAPPIVDLLKDDPDEWYFTGYTGLYYPDPSRDGWFFEMGYDAEENYSRDFFAINNDPANDLTWQKSAWPRLSLLRNAKQMTIDIVDSGNKVVDKIATEENLRNMAALTNSGYAYFGYWGWDGTKYNTATGKRAPVAEGRYTMRVKTLADGADPKVAANWQTEAWPIWVDNTMPSFQLDSALPENGFNPGPFTLSWKNATDSGSGLWGMYAILDNEVVDMAAGDAAGSFTFDLSSGKHENMLICASDNAGNAGCLGTTAAFETSYISAVGPTSFATNNPYVELKLTATEDVQKITYTIGETAPIDNGTDTTIKFNLGGKDGVSIVKVDAYADEAATTLLQSLTYEIDLDMTPPIMAISYPGEQRPIVNTRTVNVTGVLSEAHPQANGVQYTTDEGAHWTNLVTDADGNFAFQVKYTTDGRKNIKFHGTDAVGNYVEAARVFTVDASAPVITTAMDPVKGNVPSNINVMVTTPGQYTLGGTAKDSALGYYFYVNGSPEFSVADDFNSGADQGTAKNWAYDAGTVGGTDPVVLGLSAVDSAGNKAERTVTFKSAGTTPVVQILEITDADTTMKVAGKASAKVTSIIVNGTAVKPTSGNFTATVAKAESVTVLALTSDPTVAGLDMKGDKSRLVANSLTLNTVEGAWSPNGGKLQAKFTMNLKGNVTVDLLDGNDVKVKTLFTGVKNPGENMVEWDGKGTSTAQVADGTYKIKVTDGTVTMTQTVVKDTVAPATPTVLDPVTLTNVKTYVLSGMADGATKVAITVTGPSAIAAKDAAVTEGAYATSFTLVKDGTYKFTLIAVDELGNKSAAATVQVVLDTKGPGAPTVTNVPKATKADSFDAKVTPKEKGSIVIEQVSGPTDVEDRTIEVASTTAINVTFDTSALDEGTYKFNVFGVDAAGNRSATPTVITFVVDRTNPTFTFNSGVNDGNSGHGLPAKSYTITFQVNDETANTPTVTFNGKAVTPSYNATTKVYTVKGTLKNGDNLFVFNVTDAAGNAAEPVTVTITGTTIN